AHSKLRNQEQRGERWHGQRQLDAVALFNTADDPAIPDIASAVDAGVGIEDLPPGCLERDPDAIVLADLGREVHHHEAARVGIAPLAQPGEYALLQIIDDQPLETVAVGVELVERRKRAVELVEIAHDRLDAGMSALAQEVPVQAMIVAPFAGLGKLVA